MRSSIDVLLRFVVLLALVCCRWDSIAIAQDGNQAGQQLAAKNRHKPSLTLVEVPKIQLAVEGTATAEEAKQIKQLIRDLAKIDSPDIGYSSTMWGSAFAPIKSSREFGTGILMDHGLKQDSAFTQLVRFGPKALSHLLESLGDEAPTQLTIKHTGFFGAMWFDHELWGNSANEHEAKFLSFDDDGISSFDKQQATTYTVSIGDICFAAVGQITNRPYAAVRYQPSGCVVINSPVHDEQLRSEVQGIWQATKQPQALLDSLLIDFCTRGAGSNALQCGAAMRLAYYFPKETARVLTDRLLQLDVSSKRWDSRRNGDVVPADFIRHISWSREPILEKELERIFESTAIEEAMLAALPALDDTQDELAVRRLSELVEGSHFGGMIALGERYPTQARLIFADYLKPGTFERRRTMCYVLRRTCQHLSMELLSPLLDDRRKESRTAATRLCDVAAETLAMNVEELSFWPHGTFGNHDQQIEKMKAKIAEMKRRE